MGIGPDEIRRAAIQDVQKTDGVKKKDQKHNTEQTGKMLGGKIIKKGSPDSSVSERMAGIQLPVFPK